MLMGGPDSLKPISEWNIGEQNPELESLLESDTPFFLGYVAEPDLAVEMGEELCSWAQNGIETLLGFYKHIAWSKTNDCIGQGRR